MKNSPCEPEAEIRLRETMVARPARLHRCSWLLVSVVLAHGMIVSPLLVECIRADGLLLIEWIGHDPCRRPMPDREVSTSRSFTSFLCASASERDSCIDLSMDHAAVLQPRPHGPLTPMRLAQDWPGAARFFGMDGALSGTGPVYKPPGEFVSAFDYSMHLISRLRI